MSRDVDIPDEIILVPSGSVAITASLSRIPAFRHDDETHSIPIGGVVKYTFSGESCETILGERGPNEIVLQFSGGSSCTAVVVSHDRDCDGTPLYTIAMCDILPPKGAKVFSREWTLWKMLARVSFNGISEGERLEWTGETVPMRTFDEFCAGWG